MALSLYSQLPSWRMLISLYVKIKKRAKGAFFFVTGERSGVFSFSSVFPAVLPVLVEGWQCRSCPGYPA